MQDKTLGQINYEERFGDASAGGWECLNRRTRQAWEEAAQAVVAAHEKRKWRPISELPTESAKTIIGYQCEGLAWVQTFWLTGTLFTPPVKYTDWQYAPAAPEADNAGA